MMQEFAKSGHSGGVLKRKKGKDSFHCNADPNSADMLLKTIVSVSQFSIYRAVLIWNRGKRSEGDNASLNTNLNLSQELTKLTRHEASDLYCLASRDRPRSVHRNTSVGFKSRGQVSREAGFTKSVEVGQFFVTRPATVLE